MKDYWVVIVTDPDTGRERRFQFHTDPDDPEVAAGEAWSCWAKATHHGFVARAEHVRRANEYPVPVQAS